MTQAVCIYHIADLDGHCAGAIVRTANPDVEMIGMDYGQEPPWERLEGRNVIMVDFSLEPWSNMVKLYEVANHFIWIDHHESAIRNYRLHEEAGGNVFQYVLDPRMAACELAWEFFFPKRPMPKAVKLLGRYDVWDHEAMADVLAFQYGMQSAVTDPAENMKVWEMFFAEVGTDRPKASVARRAMSMTVLRGNGILEYEYEQDRRHAAAIVFEMEFAGHRWLAANIPFKSPRFFKSVADPGRYPGMIMFSFHGKHWKVALRSKSIDVSKVAESYGGGGHEGAASFICATLPFELPTEIRVTMEISDETPVDITPIEKVGEDEPPKLPRKKARSKKSAKKRTTKSDSSKPK
jgi:hypothetical protein